MVKIFSNTDPQKLEDEINHFIKQKNLVFDDDFTAQSIKYSISRTAVNDDMVTEYSALLVVNSSI